LEEALTLDELVLTYNKIVEQENNRMEFEAKIAGAEIKSNSGQQTQQANTDTNSLADRLRARKAARLESDAGKGETAFSQGVGYQVIGG
jgi:hypothetical protein